MATGTINSNSVLLWTNPNPSASFGAQTISLDLSKYKFIEVYAKDGSSAGVNSSCKARVGLSSAQLLHCTAAGDATYGTISNFRTVTATTSNVKFTDNRQVYTGSAPIATNQYNIPQEIWGIN